MRASGAGYTDLSILGMEVPRMPVDQSYLELPSIADQIRFWEKVEKSPECWNWTSAIARNYYGVFRLNGGTVYAHRVAYLLHFGTISETLVIDHICRNRRCVNPLHLRQITRGENVRIGICRNREKTYCKHGHSFESNARWLGSRRICKICHRRRNKEYKIRKRGGSIQ